MVDRIQNSLAIENLSRPIHVDDGGMASTARSQSTAIQEMRQNGVELGNDSAQAQGKSFGDLLTQSIDKVNQTQLEADHSIKEMIAGRNKNLHETMLAIEKADLSLKTMMQVRNKILEAYKEIMRMQV